jgi:hypothetical protein
MTKLMCGAGLALMIATAPAAALANNTGHRTITVQDTSSARATFLWSRECVTTFVQVQMDDTATVTIAAGTPSQKTRQKTAAITVRRTVDPTLAPQCAGREPKTLEDAELVTDSPKMTIDGGLDFARVHGETKFDDVANGTKPVLKFDLRWDGTGKRKKTRTHDVQVEPGKTVTTDDRIEERAAQACGFITETVDGKKVNHVPRPSARKDTSIKHEELRQITDTKS